jgi:hypothetical protein
VQGVHEVTDRARILAEIALRSAPRLAKCPSPSLRQLCTERAARAFVAGVDACGLSQRAVARRLTAASRGKSIDERQVREWLTGVRAVPLWTILALPRDGVAAAMIELAHALPESDTQADELLDDDAEEERGAA